MSGSVCSIEHQGLPIYSQILSLLIATQLHFRTYISSLYRIIHFM